MEPLLGQVMGFAGTFAPNGWLPCDGRLLQIAQNAALFSILGTTYGGDGITTFALPTLLPLRCENQGNATVQVIIAVQGVFPSRP